MEADISMLHELQVSIKQKLNFLYLYPTRSQRFPDAPLSHWESLYSHALSPFPWAMNS